MWVVAEHPPAVMASTYLRTTDERGAKAGAVLDLSSQPRSPRANGLRTRGTPEHQHRTYVRHYDGPCSPRAHRPRPTASRHSSSKEELDGHQR